MKTRIGQSIVGAACVLAAIGVVSIASADAGNAGLEKYEPGLSSLLRRQVVLTLVALAAFLVVVDLDYHFYQRFAPAIYVLTIVLLVLVLVPGIGFSTAKQPARRWFRFGGFGFQPSELAKLAVVFSVARYASMRGAGLGDFKKGLLPGLALVALPCFLIGIEVDLGTCLFIAVVGLALLLVAGGNAKHLLAMAGISLPAVLFVALTRLSHVRSRFEIYLHPEIDPHGKGHQALQSLIAIGNGSLAGLGLGMGRQKRFFLPEESTDFIFATIGEEVGFVGCCLIVALFAFLFIQGVRVAFRARTSFGALVALGISCTIGLQAVANIAVVTAMVPTKGIALPFISYGGSQLVMMMVMSAVLVNIAGQIDESDVAPTRVAPREVLA